MSVLGRRVSSKQIWNLSFRLVSSGASPSVDAGLCWRCQSRGFMLRPEVRYPRPSTIFQARRFSRTSIWSDSDVKKPTDGQEHQARSEPVSSINEQRTASTSYSNHLQADFGNREQPSHRDDSLSVSSTIFTPQAPSIEPINQSLNPTTPSEEQTAELPSHAVETRSAIHARMQANMDRLLDSLATASQKLNIYTGTDYTGISELRSKIIAQEQFLRSCNAAVDTAKAAQQDAIASQSASQKEVVQLLERKHSWLATDLERYMSLIRSEHVNEQAVSESRDKLRECERNLEAARQKLERLERKQYHEEQIWSDTIRRNSTWVTFGLMGVNILLLLFNVVAIEPWRRSRMVREIKTALDQKVDVSVNAATAAATKVAEAMSNTDAQEALQQTQQQQPSHTLKSTPLSPAEDEEPVSRGIVIDPSGPEPYVFDGYGTPFGYTATPDDPPPPPPPAASDTSWWKRSIATTRFQLERVKSSFANLFSDRQVSLRQVDVTQTVVQSAAVGATVGAAIAWAVTLLLHR